LLRLPSIADELWCTKFFLREIKNVSLWFWFWHWLWRFGLGQKIKAKVFVDRLVGRRRINLFGSNKNTSS